MMLLLSSTLGGVVRGGLRTVVLRRAATATAATSPHLCTHLDSRNGPFIAIAITMKTMDHRPCRRNSSHSTRSGDFRQGVEHLAIRAMQGDFRNLCKKEAVADDGTTGTPPALSIAAAADAADLLAPEKRGHWNPREFRGDGEEGERSFPVSSREVRPQAKGTSNIGRTVLLLHPPGACSAFTRSGSQYPPLGLLQLKALIADSRRVDVLEADGNRWSDEETAQHIYDPTNRPLAIGMTVTCGTKRLTHAWSTVVKNLCPSRTYEPLVIVGGPAAAYETRAIFQECPNVDVVVKGEGEVAFPRIVDILEETRGLPPSAALQELSKVPSINVRDRPWVNDGTIGVLPYEAFDTLPFPDLSASPVHMYRAPDAQRSPMITMMTQRGCIAKCAFCNTPQIHGSTIRGWSNEQIIAELKRLKASHGIQEVSFVDDVFTNRKGGPRRLCERMVEEGLDLTWYCNARADQITPRMAAAMKAAGCHQVFLGFESGCDDMLHRIDKGETVADLERGARLLKDAGINISVGFIVGLPGETQESVDKTIALCRRVRPHRVQFTRFTPIPGSKLAAATDPYHDGEGVFHSHKTMEEEKEGGKDIVKVQHDSMPRTATATPRSDGFHDRSRDDQIEEWLRQCYEQCQYKPSL